MKNRVKIIGLLLITALINACGNGNNKADGYGNFEATATIVSAESNGKLLAFEIEEGQILKQGQMVGYIDTMQLSLKKEQLLAAKNVVSSKSAGVLSQIEVLKAQLSTAKIAKDRIENLLQQGAATPQQKDDVDGKIAVLTQQIRSIEIQNSSVINELKSLDAQLKQLQDQIEKSKIENVLNGTVLVKYAEPFEIVSFGKPLYKIADLSTMQLRVYISETQLNALKIGQEVSVKVDAADAMKTYNGKITWIADEAEFTPKIIQTKEERVNLVYAVKIEVKNDGGLKIGMPAEMWLENTIEE
jgi:HlyD family secretion protein